MIVHYLFFFKACQATHATPLEWKAGGFDVDDPERPFAQNHGAGYRAVYDLGEPENSVFVISTGQSGNPLSSYYEDYAEPWRDGEYLPMLTDRAAVEEDALGTLVLNPR